MFPPQTDGLCSSDGVIIQTVTSDPASSDSLSQSQLVVEAEGQSQDDHLEATSLLEGSENVVTETQGSITDSFTDKVSACTIRIWILYIIVCFKQALIVLLCVCVCVFVCVRS